MRWLLALPLILCAGCLSQSSLDGFPLPEDARRDGAVFYVEHQPKDERHLDRRVATALQSRGLNAVADKSDSADFTVTYVDRWYWDMRTYLIDFRLDVRDAKTGVLVATGRSYQSSLSAMGKTHEEIIGNVVDIIVDGVSKPTPKKRSSSRRR